MDAVEYIKAITYMHGKGCHSCPVAKDKNGKGISCGEFQRRYPEETVEIVKDWWKEHKPKTNAEWVKEKLEEIGYPVDLDYMKGFRCPPNESANLFLVGGCDRSVDCDTCRRWWDDLHKEKK